MKSLFVLFLMCTMLTGCVSSTDLGYGAKRKQLMLVSQNYSVNKANKSFKRISGTQQKKYYTDHEKRLAQIINKMIPYADEYMQENRDIRWGVHIYTSDKTNAGALANGMITVSSKMAYNPDFNDDALAYILAHEMAHIVRNHHRESQSWKYAVSPALIATAVISGGASAIAAGVLHDGYGVTYQRHLEKEADLLGLELMAKAGFNPQYAIQVFETFYPVYLREYPALSKLPSFMQAHPDIEKRSEYSHEYLDTVMPMYLNALGASEQKTSKNLIKIQDDPKAMVLVNGKLIPKIQIESIYKNEQGKIEYRLKTQQQTKAEKPQS